MRRRLWTIAPMALVCAVAGCASERPVNGRDLIDQLGRSTTSTTTSTTILTGDPVDPETIGVHLDPDGRPYDAEDVNPATRRVETERLTTLVAPGGTIVTTSGESAPYGGDEGDPTVSFDGVERLEASVIWEVERGGDGARSILGIRLDAPDRTVDRWKPFETAYGTDGGTGAILTTSAATELLAAEDDFEAQERLADSMLEDIIADEVTVYDHDGTAGDDLIVFSNGFGDGGFPMSRGVDADGRTVSLVVWDTRYPWRLAVPDGSPPTDVTEREDQLQGCLDGRRGLLDLSSDDGPRFLRCAWNEE